jgi:hypothetical protein
VIQDPRLSELHDIALPTPVSWVPQTVGWYVLAAALLVAAAWWVVRAIQRHRANLYRREASAELSSLRQRLYSDAAPERRAALRALPELVRRTALSATADREAAAALVGEPWLGYLDAAYGGRGFSAGPGRLLGEVGYLGPDGLSRIDPAAAGELLAEVDRWIRTHRGPDRA